MYYFEELNEKINLEIEKISFLQKPENLYLPILYTLSNKGKRIRPLLCIMATELFGGKYEDIFEVAMGIEIFHNFTLLHDDIMDNSVLRRGQPTVHKKWNNNVALLSGDAMTILAYQYITKAKNNLLEILRTFSEAALQVCEGQQYDMDFEISLDISESNYLKMIELKTAVLLATSLKIGAISANAKKVDCENIYKFGINLGLAFQLQDDFLDTYGNPEKFKKILGGDIVSNKKTFLLIKTLELADSKLKKELLYWLNLKTFNNEEKISIVKKIYDMLEVNKFSEKLINSYFVEANKNLMAINANTKYKENFIDFIEVLKSRNY
ncbi:MAG: polyprenyl synthetase family protein [Bacteroidales bacterium]|jgi:geranylgeranyl diphosphate synthase type II|nr:polyprenyl synthetase family protein [Bacteroidales bacterium]